MSSILYTKEHEFIECMSDSQIRIGITQYALSELGEIVFVELKDIGESLETGDEIGSVESVKTVSGFYTPAAGTISNTNQDIINDPEQLNKATDPTWLIELKLDDDLSFDELMTADDYSSYTQSLA